MSHLNTEVMDLMKESRNIQDELQQSEVMRKAIEANKPTREIKQAGTLATSLNNDDTAPPHPLTTYCWEDVRRNKVKVSYTKFLDIVILKSINALCIIQCITASLYVYVTPSN